MGYELSHDTLAKQIFNKASTEAQTRRKVEKYIRERYQAYQERGAKLTQDDVDYIAPYQAQVSISPAETDFIKKGRRVLQRNKWMIRALVTAVILALAALTTWAVWQRGKAKDAEAEAIKQQDIAVGKSDSLVLVGNALEAALDTAEVRRIQAEENLKEANRQKGIAEKNLKEANRQKGIAEKNLTEVQKQKGIAEDNLTEAERQKGIAEENLIEAERQKGIALENEKKARIARDDAIRKSREAQSNALAAKAREAFDQDNTLALNLAYAAYKTDPGPEACAILGKVLQDTSGTFYQDAYNHGQPINAMAISPDGQTFLTGGKDGKTILWNKKAGRLHVFEGHKKSVTDVAFSPDGNMILTGSEDSTAILWNLKGEQLQPLIRHPNRVSCVAFSPSGQYILTGTDKGNIYQFEAAQKTGAGPVQYEYRRSFVIELGPFDYSRLVLSFISNDEFIGLNGSGMPIIWNMNGKEIHRIRLMPKNEHRLADKVSLAVSPGNQYILAANNLTGAKLLNTAGKEILSLPGKVVCAAFISPQSFITTYSDGSGQLWSIQGEKLRRFHGMGEGGGADIAVYPGDPFFYTAGPDGLVKLWNPNQKAGREIYRIETLDASRYASFSPYENRFLINGKSYDFEGRLSEAYSFIPKETDQVVFSPSDPDQLLSVLGSEAVLWNRKGEKLNTIRHDRDITSALFSPNGELILTGASDNTAKLWNLKDNRPIHTFAGHRGVVTSVAFSPTGDSLLTGSQDSTVILWDVIGNNLRVFKPGQAVSAVCFSPDGRSVLLGCNFPLIISQNQTDLFKDMRLVVSKPYSLNQIDLMSTLLLEDLYSQESKRIQSVFPVEALHFSPDGRTILFVFRNNEQMIKQGEFGIPFLWDVANWEGLMIFGSRNDLVRDAVFSPDGKYVITLTGHSERTLTHNWQPGPASLWLNPLQSWNPKIYKLDEEQRKQYGIEVAY